MENKLTLEIQQIKEKLIDILYWSFSIVMWFALAVSLYRTIDLGIHPVYYIQFGLLVVFLIVFFIRKNLSYFTKTCILLVTLYILGASGVLSFGLLSQGVYLLMLFTLLSGVLLNWRWGIAAFASSALTLIITSVLFLSNIIQINKALWNFAHSLSAWIMAIFVFITITLIVLIFWQQILKFLFAKIEDTLFHEETLNKVNKLLSNEIESRKEAEQLLKINYAKTKKLNKEYERINDKIHQTNEQLEITNLLLTEAKQKAQTADQLKASFLSNMSHEIRTPLNAIVGFATLIANEDLSTDEKKNYLGIIQSSSNGLVNTISDIITMAKIESGQFILYPKLMDLNAFLDEVHIRYKRDIFLQKNDHVKLIFEKRIDKDCNIIIDSESLGVIIAKLLDNAIKFTDNGYIKFIVDVTDLNYLNIEIIDSGIGISAETKTEIFEVFRQVDHGNTRKYGGIGIGLSISKGLIDLLNGTIEFTSTAGTGSSFNFSIPIIIHKTLKDIDKYKYNDYEEVAIDCKNKTILIIGKYTWDNLELNRFLQKTNAVLIYVESGFQAFDTHKEHPEIDLVIMSLFLPDMNSQELAKTLKTNAPQLPILAHMPIGRINTDTNLNEFVWDGFIESPIDKQQLTKIIVEYLANKPQ